MEDAFLLNKKANIFKNLLETLKSICGKKNVLSIDVYYDKNKLTKILNQISKDINRESKDATIDISGQNISITNDIEGVKMDISKTSKEIKRNLLKHNFNCKIITNKENPKITKSQLENIDTVLGSYSTKFDKGVSGRNQNIKLAANRTSDILLMPGETFSYNENTKKRTLNNGYKNAPVIVQEGIGGGVCQVSTTLYNATLYSGLEYLELRNHSIPSAYAPKGRDATVADDSIDFVFKNNLKYPIYIKNTVYGNTIKCEIYGSLKDKKNIEIVTNTDQVSVASVKKVDDPTLEKGRDGYVVSTYRIYKDNNGNVEKREKVAKSYYPKKQGVIAVGTMEAVQYPEIKPQQSVPENNSSSDSNTEVVPGQTITQDVSNEENQLQVQQEQFNQHQLQIETNQ